MIMLWMIFIVVSLSSLYDQMDSETKSFFRFGPNKNLIVFGIEINTYSKYSVIVVYSLINSLLRTSCRDILISWQTNNVQDITKPKKKKSDVSHMKSPVSLLFIRGWIGIFT